ncbi:preprotein translocase subunit SecE [Brevundimonas sp.]|uniref:preprotein translocase subunit SecE n=1 Tax=Brevundimonas sp. TaxID=1871086 RepID=UPI00356B2E2A
MAKAKTPSGRRTQTAQPVIAGNAVAADASPPKKRTSIPQFASQVRAEGRKIVWPSRKETWITSVMVFIMVAIAVVFFFVIDFGLARLSSFILAIGS